MHGCSSGSTLLVNAEVDSMGGVVDGGVGIGLKTSPRRAAIEKAQAELRQEYDVREERRRELEFLEKGGNPLDFKFGNAASVSVQSTSLTDQNPEQFVTSEAKGSFAASPHGDSVESSGRPGGPIVCEPNSADNLLLFDGDNDLPEAERNPLHPSRRNNVTPSEQSSQMDGTQNAKESEDSAIVRPYARRNRSRSNREGARSNSTDVVQSRGGQGSSLPLRSSLRDTKVMEMEANNEKDQNMPSVSNLKSASTNGDVVPKVVISDNQLDMDLDGAQLHKMSVGTSNGSVHDGKLDIVAPRSLQESQDNQPSQVDGQQIPPVVVSGALDVSETDHMVSAVQEPCLATTNINNETSVQPNGISNLKRENKIIVSEVQNSSTAGGTKGLDSESSCTQTSLGVDVHNDSDMCTNTRNIDSYGNTMEQTSDVEGAPNPSGGEMEKGKNEEKAVDGGAVITDNRSSLCQNHSGDVGTVKIEEDMPAPGPESDSEIKLLSRAEGVQKGDQIVSETDRKVDDKLDTNININKENKCVGRLQEPQDISMHELPEAASSGKDSAASLEPQVCPDNAVKVVDKAHEDSILEEARTIEAKRKRIAELSIRSLPLEIRRKSHWDFVLEEMAWLANDFVQERLWKMTAAAKICRGAAFSSRLRFEEQHQQWKLKEVAHALSKAVLQFWHSAEVSLNGDDNGICPEKSEYSMVGSVGVDRSEVSKDKSQESNMRESSKKLDPQHPRKILAVQGYAVRFLKYNSSLGRCLQAEAPATPDRLSDLGILDMSGEDNLTEESLFYTVPSGAMESYRKSIESHFVQFERTGSSVQEEVETSIYDAAADYGFQENPYIEDEGETSTYYLHGAFEGSKPSKSAQKKRKNSIKSYTVRSYETGIDFPYGNCTAATQQSMLLGKRPGSLNVGPALPKRMRTASRPRILSPFSGAATGSAQVQMKTDASSGDTNSFQDDQSTLHGGSQFQKSVEVESVGDFDKQLPYDCAETSMKPKKKKKAKHLGSTYDQGWQVDSAMLNDQRDHSRKRLDSNHFESNGTSGLYVQHSAKKPKILKQPVENTFDNITTMTVSIPSPVASQNNMSNTSKFIKLIGGRDRGRKAKSLKTSAGQSGPGSPWSQFEDQALVVLVHDMGPNWELISDAINSTLHFKCIFRNPKECKERHKKLMDKSAGDGADSAEDSGSSQPYPSTLPGIPKGSARQLFQRLQEPMEEDTLKSHFDKIIKIGQKQHYRRSQNESQDPKQLTQVHNSHVIALSQVHPNNLNGVFLTPLDLCDATASSPDVLPIGYQGSHPSGLAISNPTAVAPLLPSSGANSSLQGSSGMVLGGNVSSPSSALNASIRDGRYGVPRATSLPVDEQQRLQQYNPMLSGRSIQQSSLSVPGGLSGADRGVRMLPGGNGMGMMCGMNRSMPISRPGFPGMTSSSMLNSGSMLSSSMTGIPSPVNMHSGAGPGQGNSMIRPREALHMMRPGHNAEHQRQIGVPELQMQGTQGNSQGITPFNGLSAAFSNQTTPPQVQPYPGHPQQQHQVSPQQPHALGSPHHPHLQGPNHATGSQQQAYAIHFAKERQRQQRYMQQQQQQQQQQQFTASNALMSHVQSQPHHPISSTLQNSSQVQSQTSSQPVSVSPLAPSSPLTPASAQQQQKHHLPPHGLSRNPGVSGLSNQMGKQRQRQAQNQHLQQTGRNHPQQRQHVQSQPQAKLMKGVGRGLAHQNLPVDPSHLNGLSMPPGNQSLEKGEQQIMQMMQGQGVYSGSSLNPIQPSKPLIPQTSNHSPLQQKLISSSAPPASKQLQQMPSHSDNTTQGQVPSVPPGHPLSVSHQSVPTAVMASNHQQQQPQSQPHQKQVNQTQPNVQRMLQQNHQVNSEMPNKSQTDIAQADHPMSNAPQVVASMAMPQSCIDSLIVVPVSSAVAPQWKSSENSTAQAGSIGSPPRTNSAGNEPIQPVSQGIGPRQLSGGLPSHGHNVGAQWQQHQLRPPLQQSPTMPPPSQQYLQHEQQQQLQEQKSPPQLPLQQQPPQQVQHLQAGQGSMYLRPTNSKPE